MPPAAIARPVAPAGRPGAPAIITPAVQMMPLAMPISVRPASRAGRLPASARTTEPSTTNAPAQATSGRAPMRSARRPSGSVITTIANVVVESRSAVSSDESPCSRVSVGSSGTTATSATTETKIIAYRESRPEGVRSVFTCLRVVHDRPCVQLELSGTVMKKPHRMLGIEIRHLVALDAVAATGSFAQAARRLGYTQSAVSLQIAALERAAGTRLLERPGGRRPVVPTDAGERMLRHAVRLTAQLQAAEADLTALAEGTAGTLRVGTFQSVSIRVLPDAVRRLMELRPGVEVRLQEAPYEDELLAMVERGSLDFTFALVPPEGPFEHIELMRDPYVLLTQAGSALAQRESAPTLAEIGRLPLIAYSRSTYGIEALLRARGSSRTSSSAATRAARCSGWSRRASARR